MTVVPDPMEQLVALSEASIELATEIQLLLNQAIAEDALRQASSKTQALIDNAAEARRLVAEYQAHSPRTTEDK